MNEPLNQNTPLHLKPKTLSFWCHICKYEFSSSQNQANGPMTCPKCFGEFCEEIATADDNPKDFVPFDSSEILRNTAQNPNQNSLQNPIHPPSASTNRVGLNNINRIMANGNTTNQVLVFSSVGPYTGQNMLGNLISSLLTNSMTGVLGGGGSNGEDTSIEHILQYIMEHDPNQYGTPPASKQVIDQLPLKKIDKQLISKEGPQECSVCKEEFKEDEEVKEMPCKHVFHIDCLMPWLKQHNSCPTCRFELPTDDVDYEMRKQQVNSNSSSTNRRNLRR